MFSASWEHVEIVRWVETKVMKEPKPKIRLHEA